MKRQLLVLCMTVFISSHGMCIQTLSLNTGVISEIAANTTPTRDVTVTSTGVEVTYDFSQALLIDDKQHPDNVRLHIDGFSANSIPGQPSYIFRNDLFIVPEGRIPTVEVIQAEHKDYKYSLSTASRLPYENEYTPSPMEETNAVTSYNGFFPVQIVEAGQATPYRGSQSLPVRIAPVQYDMKNRTVRFYTHIKYRVSYDDTKTSLSRSNTESSHTVSDNMSFMSNVFVNHGNNRPHAAAATVEDTRDYLILTHSAFREAAERLAAWKRLMGFNVRVISRDIWGVPLIKNDIRNYYSSHPNLCYILLIGDHLRLPSEIYPSIAVNTGKYVSDFRYGCLTDNQLIPDFFRGRIPVSTLADAYTAVDKIINYERNPELDASVYRNGLHCAHFQDLDTNGYADRRFAQTSEEIRSYVLSKGKSVERVYRTEDFASPKYWNNDLFSYGEEIPKDLQIPLFKWRGNSDDISNSINNGVFYVLYRGHGTSTYWSAPGYKIQHISELRNEYKLPVVFSINCQTGDFWKQSECFSLKFLTQNNGGCVGIVTATESSVSGFNDILGCGMFDAIWPNPGISPNLPAFSPPSTPPNNRKPVYALGTIMDQGMTRLMERSVLVGTVGLSKDNFQYTQQLFHYFGDPSMEIITDVPTLFNDVSITRDNSIVVKTNGESGRITFLDEITGEIQSYIGDRATYNSANPDDVTVCISGHNKVPYIEFGKSNVLYFQNVTVTGRKKYKASVIEAGDNVQSSKDIGNVVFADGEVDISADKIIFNGGTTIDKGCELRISIK